MNTEDNGNEILLAGKGLSKAFPGVKALSSVNITCRKGRVLALVGENGAGKSTLCNILGGVFQPDSGQVLIEGKPVVIRDPYHAQNLGIAFVHQENSLLPYLTVGENILLGHEPGTYGFLDNRRLAAAAAAILREINVGLSVDAMVFSLSPAQMQMVEIAKAWSHQPKLLILDEPTSSLSSAEVAHLMQMLTRFREKGTSIIFISHRLDEIFQIADDAMVLKDGQTVGSRPVAEIDKDELIRMMVGREMTQAFPARPATCAAQPLLELKGVTLPGRADKIDITVNAGQIVGIGGLEGQGQRELIRGLFGITGLEDGEIIVNGRTTTPKSPSHAIALGLAYVSDDRKMDGLVLPLSVKENMTLARLQQFSKYHLLDNAKETSVVERFVRQLSIKVSSINQKIRTLSGGNQQKVILGKWLLTEPKVFLLHEPTRGIDMETKMDIYRLLRELANQGAGVLLLTGDMLELIGLADLIYVMYEGRIVGNVNGPEATEEHLMYLSSGGEVA
jgi:ABC-type sugar transport system ATPase subunit